MNIFELVAIVAIVAKEVYNLFKYRWIIR